MSLASVRSISPVSFRGKVRDLGAALRANSTPYGGRGDQADSFEQRANVAGGSAAADAERRVGRLFRSSGRTGRSGRVWDTFMLLRCRNQLRSLAELLL